MPCFVCNSTAAVSNEHHIVPRSDGGTDGPTVILCPNCHTLLHNAAKKGIAGKSYEGLLVHLDDGAKNRITGLIQVILFAALNNESNPHPMLTAVLDDPSYLVALKRYQTDHGFTSQNATINAILRRFAQHYGIIDDRPTKRKKVAISSLNS